MFLSLNISESGLLVPYEIANLIATNTNILHHYLQEMGRLSNNDFEYSLTNHKAILEALKNRDAQKAKDIILKSMDYNLSRFKAVFKKK